MVQLPIRAATRDERAFAGGTDVRIGRTPSNRIAFGAGPDPVPLRWSRLALDR